MGPYELLEPVGRGGMGTVYRARHRETGQVVAVKVMAADTAADPVLLRRFEQEFLAARSLRHRHIVHGLGFGLEDGRPYLVMELVEGQNLRQRVLRAGPLPQDEAVRVICHVAEGLQLAHENKLIHRDVKPDNILLAADGLAKLTDLGLIKDLDAETSLTRSRTCLGTVNFMAPEQFEDARNADARCDIYGLGATLYYALTGVVPFQERGNLAVLRKKLRNDLVPPSRLVPGLHAEVDQAVCRALDAAPQRRQASCRELINTLTGIPLAAAQAGGAPPRAGQALPSTEERRADPRFPSALEASCRPVRGGKDQWLAEVQDISLTGIRLELERRFEPGAVLAIAVLEEQQETTAMWLATVRWVRMTASGRWSVGCAFTSPLSENDLNLLLEGKTTTVVVHLDGGNEPGG
jgi:serine/threonine protein kinase